MLMCLLHFQMLNLKPHPNLKAFKTTPQPWYFCTAGEGVLRELKETSLWKLFKMRVKDEGSLVRQDEAVVLHNCNTVSF